MSCYKFYSEAQDDTQSNGLTNYFLLGSTGEEWLDPDPWQDDQAFCGGQAIGSPHGAK